LSARSLSAGNFSTIAVLWSLLFALSTGAFYPVEQTLTRQLAVARAHGRRWQQAATTPMLLAAAILVVLLVIVAIGSAFLAGRLFAGEAGIGVVLASGLAVTAGLYVVRGVFAGTRRLGWYGAQLASEGLLRVVAVGALWLLGVHNTLWYGWILVIAAGVTLVWSGVVAVFGRVAAADEQVGATESVRTEPAASGLGWLLVATVLSQGLVNIGPVVLAGRADTTSAAAGQFLATYVLVRIPLLFTSVVQASLVPPFVDALVRADVPAYRRAWRRAILVVGSFGAAAVIGVALIGPQVLSILFGSSYSASRVVMVMLTVSSAVLLLASVCQAALVALGRQRRVALVWLLAALTFVAALLLPFSGIAVVTWATTLSAFVALAGLAAATIDPGSRAADVAAGPSIVAEIPADGHGAR
jgi:O-antigen/teichoic acid export membrane protein